MNRQKYDGKNNLWDDINSMIEMGLNAEGMASALFRWFDVDDVQSFVEYLHDEGY